MTDTDSDALLNRERQRIPYGSWPSKLTAERILAGARRLGQPRLDAGNVYWLESRPEEGGRQVVVAQTLDGEAADITAAGANVRTRVHEYGGGDYAVDTGEVVFSEFDDQRVRWLAAGGGEPCLLSGAGARYADFVWSPDRRWLAAVEERANAEDPEREPENRIVVFAMSDGPATQAPQVVAEGDDFYSSPRFSPDGTEIAYLSWDHPQMPWDGTALWLQPFGAGGPEGEALRIAGGAEESIFQPAFSPAGKLTFVSDRSGWWNLYQRQSSGEDRPLCPMEAEFGRPQWVFGMSTWAFIGEDEILCSVSRDGSDRLCRLGVSSRVLRDLELSFSNVIGIDVEGATACFIGAGAETAAGVYTMSLVEGDECGSLVLHRASFDVELDPAEISRPESISFQTAGGRTAHAFFYPPTAAPPEGSGLQGAVAGPVDERPPLLVKSHGGPTAATLPVLNLAIQYWTSRGFAVVDVNYGGSTGYGRAYRDLLRGAWGIVDVEDCVHAARSLADEGRVDPGRLAISGGSAGGYTTLCALTFYDDFAAGASHYGIGDLEALARDTHKFESRYTDSLVGPYPEAVETYQARSPIQHTEQLSCPVIFFQGLEDRVVPPNQAEAMVEALAKRGIRHAHVTFPGEQHGFRRAENIRTALEGELWFYGQIFGFDVDVAPVGIEIRG